MGLSVLNQPAAAGGGIKSVQRGSAGGAGNVTITAVDIAKSFVTVFGTASSGTVAASAVVNAQNGNQTLVGPSVGSSNSTLHRPGSSNTLSVNFVSGSGSNNDQYGWTQDTAYNSNASNLSGGSNNLVAAVVQGFLANSTTLTVSGACRYEVVEFN